MGCKICKLPQNIPCKCHLKHIYYEDENGITKHSTHEYDSLESFLKLCRECQVNMDKINNPRWGKSKDNVEQYVVPEDVKEIWKDLKSGLM